MADLAESAAAALKTPAERFVLDLSRLSFIDCCGVRVLAAITRTIPAGCPVIVRSVSPAVRRVLDLMGLNLESRAMVPGNGAARLVLESQRIRSLAQRPVVLHWTTWYRWAGKTRWDQLVIRVWSAVLIVIGAAILAVELKPRRVTRLPLHSENDATDAAVTRRGLAGTLRAAATGVDGVSAAAETVRRRRARVSATAAARGRAATEALRQPVTQVLQDRLDGLDLRQPPRLKMRVYSRSR